MSAKITIFHFVRPCRLRLWHHDVKRLSEICLSFQQRCYLNTAVFDSHTGATAQEFIFFTLLERFSNLGVATPNGVMRELCGVTGFSETFFYITSSIGASWLRLIANWTHMHKKVENPCHRAFRLYSFCGVKMLSAWRNLLWVSKMNSNQTLPSYQSSLCRIFHYRSCSELTKRLLQKI